MLRSTSLAGLYSFTLEAKRLGLAGGSTSKLGVRRLECLIQLLAKPRSYQNPYGSDRWLGRHT